MTHLYVHAIFVRFSPFVMLKWKGTLLLLKFTHTTAEICKGTAKEPGLHRTDNIQPYLSIAICTILY